MARRCRGIRIVGIELFGLETRRGGALFEANSLANYLKQVDDVQGAANGILDTISSAVGNDLASGIKAVGAFAAGAAVGEAVMIGITGIAVFYG